MLTGSGRSFCTGVDLSSLGDLSGPPSPETIDAANRAVAGVDELAARLAAGPQTR